MNLIYSVTYTQWSAAHRANFENNTFVSGAYCGVSLHQTMNEGGGVRDVFSCGHVTKRDLYNRMHAYLVACEA